MMTYSLFSATGCMRCKIVKSYMNDNNIDYQEFDFKADGKEEFNAFYRTNRSRIFRGDEGVEFPLLFDGDRVVQGVGVIIAFFKNEALLGRSVFRSNLSHGWVSGLNITTADDGLDDRFIDVVSFLKAHGLQIQIDTDGRNSRVLGSLIEKLLIDRLVFNLNGPADLYEKITGIPIQEKELAKSLSLLDQCPEYQIVLPITPFQNENGTKDT